MTTTSTGVMTFCRTWPRRVRKPSDPEEGWSRGTLERLLFCMISSSLHSISKFKQRDIPIINAAVRRSYRNQISLWLLSHAIISPSVSYSSTHSSLPWCPVVRDDSKKERTYQFPSKPVFSKPSQKFCGSEASSLLSSRHQQSSQHTQLHTVKLSKENLEGWHTYFLHRKHRCPCQPTR
jgi:hypothetical protein